MVSDPHIGIAVHDSLISPYIKSCFYELARKLVLPLRSTFLD